MTVKGRNNRLKKPNGATLVMPHKVGWALVRLNCLSVAQGPSLRP
jgi:hypothetical protein